MSITASTSFTANPGARRFSGTRPLFLVAANPQPRPQPQRPNLAAPAAAPRASFPAAGFQQARLATATFPAASALPPTSTPTSTPVSAPHVASLAAPGTLQHSFVDSLLAPLQAAVDFFSPPTPRELAQRRRYSPAPASPAANDAQLQTPAVRRVLQVSKQYLATSTPSTTSHGARTPANSLTPVLIQKRPASPFGTTPKSNAILSIARHPEPTAHPAAGRMCISGRIDEVCAALDRLAAG